VDSTSVIEGDANPEKAELPSVPVEEPESSPADELVEELAPRLDEIEESRLASRVMTGYHAALQERIEWETRLAE